MGSSRYGHLIEALAKRLMEVPYGGMIRHEQLAAVIGGQAPTPYLLRQARAQAQAEIGAVFEPVSGVGLRHLRAEEAVVVGRNALRGARNQVRTGDERVAAMTRRANDLSPEVRREIAAQRAHLGLLETLMAPSVTDENAGRSGDQAVRPAEAASAEFRRLIGA